MKSRLYFVALLAGVTSLATLACGAPVAPSPPAAGFIHDRAHDVFGYYMPQRDVRFGKWQMSSLNIGTPQDFTDYEKGKRDPPQYAPVMIEFDDMSSPETTTEEGATVRSVQRRVLPTSYAITGGHIAFAGKDAVLGAVSFTGTLDLAAIRRAQNPAGESTEAFVVLTGDLSVGGQTVRNITFTWFGGD